MAPHRSRRAPSGGPRARWAARALLCGCAALAAAGPSMGAGGGEAARLARARLALHELAHQYVEAEPQRRANLYHCVPALVGEAALGAVAGAAPAERGRILEHVQQRCAQARLDIVANVRLGRAAPAVPPAAPLGDLTLEPGGCRHGERWVLPVAVGEPVGPWVARFFAGGEFARFVPAVAGATPARVERSEVFRVFGEVPDSRRVGWDRPAGGVLRDPSGSAAAALVQLEHPTIREAIAHETATAMAAWPKGREPLYHSLGGGWFYVDYSERSARQFLAWLEREHKTLRVVNAVWDTKYRELGPALMPRPEEAKASAPRWHDWVAFNQARFTAHVRWAVGNVRRAAPRARLGLSVARYLLAGGHGLSGVDPAALVPLLDVVEANGAGALATDLCVALAGGAKPVADAAAGRPSFGILPHFLHGCAAVRLPAWPPQPLVTLAAVRAAERALVEALDARRLAPQVRQLAAAPASVALLYSEASMRLVPPWAVRCAATPYTRRLAGAYEAARLTGRGCRFVTGDDVLRRRLGGASVVVVAGSPAERERVARALVDQVELGLHVVVVAGSLRADELGHEADHLRRLGVEVVAAKVPTYTTAPSPDAGALDSLVAADVPTAALSARPDGPLAGIGRALCGRGLRQTVRVNVDHELWAMFAGGEPAVVSFPRGKGRVTYVAMPLEPPGFAAVLEAALRRAKAPEPPVRLVAADGRVPEGVEYRSVRAGGRVLAYAWNTTAAPTRVSFHARGARAASNLSTGKALALRADGERVVVEAILLAPYATAVVELRTAPAP